MRQVQFSIIGSTPPSGDVDVIPMHAVIIAAGLAARVPPERTIYNLFTNS
jgi:hypothetical protein